MKLATFTLVGETPITFGRYHDSDKLSGESNDAYEDRTWREKAHTDSNDEIVIPPFNLKNCLFDAAKFFPTQVPGAGKTTYTKSFESGIIVNKPVKLGVKKSDCEKLRLYVRVNVAKENRVWRNFPSITNWFGDAEVYILDDRITEEVFRKTLHDAGNVIGIGSLRPRNGGMNGTFKIENFVWKVLE